jgi:hypothetical protein
MSFVGFKKSSVFDGFHLTKFLCHFVIKPWSGSGSASGFDPDWVKYWIWIRIQQKNAWIRIRIQLIRIRISGLVFRILPYLLKVNLLNAGSESALILWILTVK